MKGLRFVVWDQSFNLMFLAVNMLYFTTLGLRDKRNKWKGPLHLGEEEDMKHIFLRCSGTRTWRTYVFN